MPILKLSYNEIISESKINILKAIDEAAGGYIERLEQLESISGGVLKLHNYNSKEQERLERVLSAPLFASNQPL